MRFDKNLMFSDAQELSSTETEATNVVDIANAGLVEGEAFIAVRVIEGTNGGGLKGVALQGSTDNSEFKDLITVAVPEVTDPTPGGVNIKIPQGCPRYLKLKYTGEELSGKVTAGITLAVDSAVGKRIGDFEAN